jgi:membrane peptidoglycan carboxypeptidase
MAEVSRGWSREVAALRRREAVDPDWFLGGWPFLARPTTFGRAKPPRPRLGRWAVFVALAGIGLAAWYEVRTSAGQAWLLSRWAGEASYSIEPGRSPEALYPRTGSFNQRLGYTRLGDFRDRLEANGFRTVEQTRFSPGLTRLVRWGISPPFREPADAGLAIRDARGAALFDFTRRRPHFERFEEIPAPILHTLLYIEDRRLVASESDPRANPVVDWKRLTGASARYVGQKIGLPVRLEGGSTLATQMEKYRHSTGGRTDSPVEKLRQMTSASLKVYRDGPDTSEERRQLVQDYLNSVPLSAAPGYGEVNGFGEGLRVWFGVDLDDLRSELDSPGVSENEARMFKQAVALLYSIRAPSRFLVRDRQGLSAGADAYLRLLRADGIVEAELVDRALEEPLVFPDLDPPAQQPRLAQGKAVSEIRRRMSRMLGVNDLYTLDRLHIDATATIDAELQQATMELFRELARPEFITTNGLSGERLLATGDPSRVVYSLLLVEATEDGNLVRVHADSYPGALDANAGIKLELGSTAKLRTLTHYLDVVAEIHASLAGSDPARTRELARDAPDLLTRWVAETISARPELTLAELMEAALERTYSAGAGERFFTGGGLHAFHNFDPEDNGLVLSVRQATQRSTNLVFVRLMRDLVRYHEARLAYDAATVLSEIDDPVRAELLQSIAEEESRAVLRQSWMRLRRETADSMVEAVLGQRADSPRRLAVAYFAWHGEPDEAGLLDWLRRRRGETSDSEARRLFEAYGDRRLSIADYGYLAGVDPLELWCAGRLIENPQVGWDELVASSDEARRTSFGWLFKTRNRRAQDVRLRTRIERDAFERMTTHWRELGFPFERMVPSYASAIGSSADRPTALADLMGILVNDGVRRPATMITEVRLAADTPYYTALEAVPEPGERVLAPEVARAVRGVLAGVVQEGTARRLRGAFLAPDGTTELVVGGKTGSGDNRRSTFGRDGGRITSETLNRTAAFVFYIGDRHYGVVTASVEGPDAENYEFTSSLPLAVLRLLAPQISGAI